MADAVVNSASVFEHDAADTFSAERLAQHMQVNLTAPLLLAQGLAKHLQARQAAPAEGRRRRGRIQLDGHNQHIRVMALGRCCCDRARLRRLPCGGMQQLRGAAGCGLCRCRRRVCAR